MAIKNGAHASAARLFSSLLIILTGEIKRTLKFWVRLSKNKIAGMLFHGFLERCTRIAAMLLPLRLLRLVRTDEKGGRAENEERGNRANEAVRRRPTPLKKAVGRHRRIFHPPSRLQGSRTRRRRGGVESPDRIVALSRVLISELSSAYLFHFSFWIHPSF